jgi:hypothetical protein
MSRCMSVEGILLYAMRLNRTAMRWRVHVLSYPSACLHISPLSRLGAAVPRVLWETISHFIERLDGSIHESSNLCHHCCRPLRNLITEVDLVIGWS